MTVPQPRPRLRKPLDAGPLQPMARSGCTWLPRARRLRRCGSVRGGAVVRRRAARFRGLPHQVGAGGPARRQRWIVWLLGRYSDAHVGRTVQGAADNSSSGRRRRTAPGPDGRHAPAEGHRETGPGLHQRRTIGPGEGLPGPHVRPAPEHRDHRGVQGDRHAPGLRAGDPRRSDVYLWNREITVHGKGGVARIVGSAMTPPRPGPVHPRPGPARAGVAAATVAGHGSRGQLAANGIYR